MLDPFKYSEFVHTNPQIFLVIIGRRRLGESENEEWLGKKKKIPYLPPIIHSFVNWIDLKFLNNPMLSTIDRKCLKLQKLDT